MVQEEQVEDFMMIKSKILITKYLIEMNQSKGCSLFDQTLQQL